MAVITALSPPVHSDEQLVDRLMAGERDALEELFRRYRLVAYRVAYRLAGREVDALEAVQKGFIQALTPWHGFRGQSAFKTWLLRVVSQAALARGRKRHRLPGQPHAFQDPVSGRERADSRHLLDEALATLPEALRRMFVLHAEGELNYREVAEAMGMSRDTVMSRLCQARQQLRAYLARPTPS
jgi:RNA polymerase sigma-70 factor (ECF subfamily)